MPQLGQLVQVTRGKEAGSFAVIVGIVDHKIVLLADGARHTGTDPKRKNIAHITLLDQIDQSVAMEIEQKGHVQIAKLRFCLNRFVQAQNGGEAKKGSEPVGER
jgi:large subunit ribosomal protein L14e